MLFSTVLVAAILGGELQISASHSNSARSPVIDARLCDVSADPDAWNRKRIRLSGIVTHEFERFTIADPGCPDAADAVRIWLTLGGRVSPGVVHCCPGEGSRHRRRQQVEIEGLTIPLVEDTTLARFVRLLRGNKAFSGRAVLVGTSFAGQPGERCPASRGYGHLGCCTLFVIEQVEQLAPLSATGR